ETAESAEIVGEADFAESAEVVEESEPAEEGKPAEEVKTEKTVEAAEKVSFVQSEVKQTILDRIPNPDENLSAKEFSECVTAYAESKGYQIEDSAYLTIAVLADEMQKKGIPLSLNNAVIMVDDAITRIQKRNPLDKIVDRYSKKHAYLLKDKHFYWNNYSKARK
ncbi:MAG: hypothetical protein ACI4D3_06040, partial [Lachnospiraceae bacterium]